MKFDLTITVSVIVALCAIISPIITSVINNHYQIKLKEIELHEKNLEQTVFYKRTIFENYLKYAGRFILDFSNETAQNYGEWYALALLYAPESLHSQMNQLHKYLRSYSSDAANELLEQITPQIHTLISTP